MMLTGFYHKFLAEMGNEPGEQQGNVTVHLINPVEGKSEITGPSGALTVAAEAGSVVGIMVQAEGRRLFIPGTNIAGIVDSLKDDKKRTAGRGSASSS